MLFRLLLAAGGAGGDELGDWNAALSTLTTETGDVANGAVVSSIADLSEAEVPLAGVLNYRPVIDRTTVPGLRLIAFDSDDYLAATVTSTVRTLVILFRIPASPAERTLIARDTSATTTKPAFSIGLTA